MGSVSARRGLRQVGFSRPAGLFPATGFKVGGARELGRRKGRPYFPISTLLSTLSKIGAFVS